MAFGNVWDIFFSVVSLLHCLSTFSSNITAASCSFFIRFNPLKEVVQKEKKSSCTRRLHLVIYLHEGKIKNTQLPYMLTTSMALDKEVVSSSKRRLSEVSTCYFCTINIFVKGYLVYYHSCIKIFIKSWHIIDFLSLSQEVLGK